MNGSDNSRPPIRIRSPKTSKNSNEQNKKANGLRFEDEERKTVIAIFDILLDGKKTKRTTQCVDAMEELFGLAYKRRLSGKVEDGDININPVVREAVQKFDVTAEDIIGPKRSDNVVRARRWTAMKLRRGGMSYTNIGKLLNRTHSTIMHIIGAKR
jgi:hypothetical protein